MCFCSLYVWMHFPYVLDARSHSHQSMQPLMFSPVVSLQACVMCVYFGCACVLFLLRCSCFACEASTVVICGWRVQKLCAHIVYIPSFFWQDACSCESAFDACSLFCTFCVVGKCLRTAMWLKLLYVHFGCKTVWSLFAVSWMQWQFSHSVFFEGACIHSAQHWG